MSDFLKNPTVMRIATVAVAAGVYALAHKFPDYAKELAGLAALLAPSVLQVGSAPAPKADQ